MNEKEDYSRIFKEFALFYSFNKYRDSLIERYKGLPKKEKIRLIKNRQQFKKIPKFIQIIVLKSVK